MSRSSFRELGDEPFEEYRPPDRGPDPQQYQEQEEPDRCVKCGAPVEDCDCTGGPETEVECTCYEPQYGHQPGCAFYEKRGAR